MHTHPVFPIHRHPLSQYPPPMHLLPCSVFLVFTFWLPRTRSFSAFPVWLLRFRLQFSSALWYHYIVAWSVSFWLCLRLLSLCTLCGSGFSTGSTIIRAFHLGVYLVFCAYLPALFDSDASGYWFARIQWALLHSLYPPSRLSCVASFLE